MTCVLACTVPAKAGTSVTVVPAKAGTAVTAS